MQGDIKDAIFAASVQFDQASGVINRAFSVSGGIGIDKGTDGQVKADLRSIEERLDDLCGIIDKGYVDRDDGYN